MYSSAAPVIYNGLRVYAFLILSKQWFQKAFDFFPTSFFSYVAFNDYQLQSGETGLTNWYGCLKTS